MKPTVLRTLTVSVIFALPIALLITLTAVPSADSATSFGSHISDATQSPSFSNTYGMVLMLVIIGNILSILALLFSMNRDQSKTDNSPRITSNDTHHSDEEAPTTVPTGDRELGTVKWFNYNKGFGFISRNDGTDIFVHFRSIDGRGRRSLREGQEVEFSVKDGDKGLQASDVVPIT